jgi:hypothetical protein
MAQAPLPKGTWFHRFVVRLLTVFLGILIYWILGFLIRDIRGITGPDYATIEARYLDQGLVKEGEDLDRQIAELTKKLNNQTEAQRVLSDGSRSLQQTINQLLELQKLSLQKEVSPSPAEQANFSSSLALFLENQKKYQDLSQEIVVLVENKQHLVATRELISQQLERQRAPAYAEYQQLRHRHELKLAFLQLAVLLPILLVAVILLYRRRGSLYYPIFLALGVATLIRVSLVVHEYFPSRFFKYVLIGALTLVVLKLLIHFIKAIAAPRVQWLLKQYREAYERFLCPVCEYPIRIGPRRFLYWTRRTVNKLVVPTGGEVAEECYTCPACGQALFETCPACQKVRHTMLPHCCHCGAEKTGQ